MRPRNEDNQIKKKMKLLINQKQESCENANIA